MAALVFWAASPALLVALIVALVAARVMRRRARDFWVQYLVDMGPTPIDKIPRFGSLDFQVMEFRLAKPFVSELERLRRGGLIEVTRSGPVPIIQASGYARSLMGQAAK